MFVNHYFRTFSIEVEMEKTLERIQFLCEMRGITIAELERNLHYGNGSLKKPKSIKNERLRDIAKYFNVSVDYLIDGNLDDLIHLQEIAAQIGVPNNLDELLKLQRQEKTSEEINDLLNRVRGLKFDEKNEKSNHALHSMEPYEKDRIEIE